MAVAKSLVSNLPNGIDREAPNLTVGQLEAFTNGGVDLAVELKKALTELLFDSHAIFDPESKMLKSAYADRPRLPTPVAPPSFVFVPGVHYVAQAAGNAPCRQPKATSRSRPSWAGEYYPTKVEPNEQPRKVKEPFVRTRPE
jgi:hypothetical protein